MSIQGYTSRCVVGWQINRLTCAGVPMTVINANVALDGDNNVILVPAGGDAGEMEVGRNIETIAAQTDGTCYAGRDQTKTLGHDAVWRRCSKMNYDLLTLIEAYEPVFDATGQIAGLGEIKVTSDDCGPCDGFATCESDGFSIMQWACIFDCNDDPIRNAAGQVLFELGVARRVSEIAPGGRRRRSCTASNNRVDMTLTLRENAAWRDGPGNTGIIPLQPAVGAAAADYGKWAFSYHTTPIGFPGGASCDCEESWAGRFLTAADRTNTAIPVPVGG